MSEKGDQSYFGDGVAEEILNALAQMEDLKVIGRTSSFSFKNKEMSIREIGKQLNVNTVLEGSIRKDGDRLRINTNLINATSEKSIWVETYDRKLDDIFAIQREIARRIAEKMKVRLMPDEKESFNLIRTNNQKAYDAYLKGIYATQRDLDNEQASVYFLDAIRLDPSFVDAYNGLGITHTLDVYSGLKEPKVAFSQAFQLLELAKNINPNTEEIFTLWHDINLWYQWDWDKMQADIEADRFKDSPYLYDRFYAHALFYGMQGQFEKAIQNIETAFEYEPLRISCRIDHITLLFAARQFEKGEELIHTYVQQFPQKGFHYKLARLYFWKGEYSQALAAFQAAENIHQDLSAFDTFIDQALIISSLAKLGRIAEAQDLLAQLHEKQKDRYVDPLTFALPYYYLNEKEKALAYLESAFYQRSYWLSYAKTHPFYDPFRKEPRFESILKSMKFLKR